MGQQTIARELPPLTQQQARVLTFLYTYFVAHRYYPTQREIMEAIGVKGTTAVAYTRPLEAKGYIDRRHGSGTHGRNLRITKAGIEKLGLMGELGNRDQLGLFDD